MTSETVEPLRSAQRLYARIWRWHFFAALLVIPFVLWQSVTGVLYLWHEEIADWVHEDLRFTHARSGPDARVAYDEQLATALAHHPDERLAFMRIAEDPRRTTMFSFSASNDLAHPAFVDPYTGQYLGAVESTHWLPGLTRSLHGGWPINPYGSYLLELGASWAIVMVLTGLYLWWPRNTVGLAGVAYPRLRSGSRTFWRDLHSVVGVYFALIFLVFLLTALPWTAFWGEKLLKPIQERSGQVAPTAEFFGGRAAKQKADHAGHRMPPLPPSPAERVGRGHGLDDLIAVARANGARGTIEVWSLSGATPINARTTLDRTSTEMHIKVGLSGEVLAKATWQDYPLLPKIIATGVDLHEGTFFGRANQIFNTVLAVALIWLSVTGFIGWYKRRPNGGFAAPPKRELQFSLPLIASGAALCMLLPMLGASVLLILGIDTLTQAARRLFSERSV